MMDGGLIMQKQERLVDTAISWFIYLTPGRQLVGCQVTATLRELRVKLGLDQVENIRKVAQLRFFRIKHAV